MGYQISCTSQNGNKRDTFQIAEVDYDICVEQYHKAKKSLDRKYKREISGNILLADWNAWCIFCALYPNEIELLDGGGIIYKGEQIYLRKALGGDWLIGIIDTDNKCNHEYPIKESDYLLALERFKEAKLCKEEYPAIQNAKEIWKLWCNSGEYKLYKFSHSPANDSYRIDAGNTCMQIIAYRGEYRLWRNLNDIGDKTEYKIDKATFDELVKLHIRESEKRSILEKSHPPEENKSSTGKIDNVTVPFLIEKWNEWCLKGEGLKKHKNNFHVIVSGNESIRIEFDSFVTTGFLYCIMYTHGTINLAKSISKEQYEAMVEEFKKSESGEKENYNSVESLIKLWNEFCKKEDATFKIDSKNAVLIIHKGQFMQLLKNGNIIQLLYNNGLSMESPDYIQASQPISKEQYTELSKQFLEAKEAQNKSKK